MATLTRYLLVGLTVAAAPACGKKKTEGGAGSGSGSTTTTTTTTGSGSGSDAGSGSGSAALVIDAPEAPLAKETGCNPPEEITGEYTLADKCVAKPAGSISIRDTGSLIMPPGTQLLFAKDAYFLQVHGKLVAKGTAEAPVVISSADPKANPGDWGGIVFYSETAADNVLDHAVVSYAGASGPNGKAGIRIASDVSPDRITITNSEISNNVGGGIVFEGNKSKQKIETNTFKADDKIAIAAPADIWSSIGTNTFGDQTAHVTDGGPFTKTGAWPKVDSMYVLEANVVVSGPDAPILTLPEGGTIAFQKGRALEVGSDTGGGLVAKNVTFTSAETVKDEGDWAGVMFWEKATGTSLDGCTIEYTGAASSYGAGAIIFTAPTEKLADRVKITNLKLQKTHGLGILAPDAKCAPYDADATNKSDGAPLCQPAS